MISAENMVFLQILKDGAFSPFILSSIFLLLIVKYLRPKHGNSEKFNLPPGPKKLTIIGNLHQLVGSKLPHQRLTELAKKHGPVMHLRLGEINVVMVSDPETAKEALKTQDPIFANRPSCATEDLMSFGNSSFFIVPHGEYWRQMRKVIVLELLSSKRVQSFRSIREEEAKNIVDCVSSTKGSVFNLSNKVSAYISSVICKATIGQDLNPTQQEEVIQLIRMIAEVVGGFSLADFYPSMKGFLRRFSGMKKKVEGFNEKVNNMLDNIISDHKSRRSTDSNYKNKINKEDRITGDHEDLVHVFLRIQESNETGFSITTEDIKAVINDNFGAGTESSASTIDWAMAEMLRNPNVMNKAQSEVREALQGKDCVEESDIEGLKYLKLVIKETLRLHPPVPLDPRASKEKSSCKINGYDVPPHSKVLINLWAIGRHPRYWKDPEKFEPERFLESSVSYMGTHFQYIPFGAGRRICPGIAFAIVTVEMVLAALLYHFDWKLPNGPNPLELDMSESFGITLKRRNDLNVIATKVR